MKKKPSTYWQSILGKVLLVAIVMYFFLRLIGLMAKISDPTFKGSFFSGADLTWLAIFLVFCFLSWQRNKRERIVKEGFNELMYFSANGKKWDVIDQLNAGINPDAQDVVGGTALIYAAKNGQEDVVRVLLERGANPTLTTVSGKTASDFARAEGYIEIAEKIDSLVKERATLA